MPKSKTTTENEAPEIGVRNFRAQMEQLALNTAKSRSKYWAQLVDPRRNYNDVFGYPDEINDNDYWNMYDRLGLAKRIVEVYPDESWKVNPTVKEVDSEEDETEFEKALTELGSSLGTIDPNEENYFKTDDETNPIWGILRQLDIDSGIGESGLLLFGLDDKDGLEQPVKESGNQLLFLNTFHSTQFNVATTQDDKSKPRYKKPELYNINSSSGEQMKVHWTRVIEVAQPKRCPRLRPVFNDCQDAIKVYGAGAETYWQGALNILSMESTFDPGDYKIDTDSLKDMMEQVRNGMQREVFLEGLKANRVAPTVVSPAPQIEAILNHICITLGVPKRIFLGSERGELASSQDSKAWNQRLTGRRNRYITPKLVMPFINRCIKLGILPVPSDKLVTRWDEEADLEPKEKAEVNKVKVQTLVGYAESPDAQGVISEKDFLVKYMDETPESAKELLDNVEEVEPEEVEEEEVTQPTQEE